jgi:hypothetical protein
MASGDTNTRTVPPLWHWLCVLAVASVLTAVLFTRCCGHLLGPVALLLAIPYILGALVSGITDSRLEALGFAVGLAFELGIAWWLVRAAVLVGTRRSRRLQSTGQKQPAE